MLRIKNVKILNTELNDNVLAKQRFRQALSYLALEQLDKISTTIKSIGLVFGTIFFKENGKLIKANLTDGEKAEGNLYVAIIKDDTVVTLLLLNSNLSNQDILEKCNKNSDNVKIEKLINIKGQDLDMSSNKRDAIIIDLDLPFAEWNKLYPIMPKLKNNPWSNSAFSKQEIEDMEIKQLDADKVKGKNKVYFSPMTIPMDLKPMIKEKEFVIYAGMNILVNIDGQIKNKIIRQLIVDERGEHRTFALEFENTLKPMNLALGTSFIISPEVKNVELLNLMGAFGLSENDEIAFQGPIVKFNYYKIGKGGSTIPKLGIVIQARQFLEIPTKFLAAA